MTDRQTMLFPAERSQLAAIRRFVAQQAEKTPAAQREIQDIVQAVDEAATNIIVHGYGDGPGQIQVEWSYLPGRITVILRDRAPFFDPTTVPEPDTSLPLFERPVGGLGVHLIRKCVDEFTYTPNSRGGNELRMVKYIKDNGGLA
jgi:serine/threonine-protein kinase RsbW